MPDEKNPRDSRSGGDRAATRIMKRDSRRTKEQNKEQSQQQKASVYEHFEESVDMAEFGRIFPTFSAYQIREMQEKSVGPKDLNLQNYFTLRPVNLKLISQELIDKVKENTGIDEESVLGDLPGDFFYYLAYYPMKDTIQSFTGSARLKILKALTLDLLQRKGIEDAREIANHVMQKDESALLLAFVPK